MKPRDAIGLLLMIVGLLAVAIGLIALFAPIR